MESKRVIANISKTYFLIFIIVFIAILFRRYDAIINPQLWAEDGAIFLQQTEGTGIRSLFTTYAGYLHLLPRLISYLFKLLSVNLEYIPLCYNIVCFSITFYTSIYIWRCTTHLKHRILFSTIFLFLPIGADLFMNITNLFWITSLYLICFLWVGYKLKNNYFDYVFILILSLTGPFSLILSPIIIITIIIERNNISKKIMFPLLVLLIGAFIQLVCLKHTGKLTRGDSIPTENLHLLKLATNNISDLMLFNTPLFSNLTPENKTIISCIILLIMSIIFIIKNKKIVNNKTYILALAGVLYMISFIAAFWPLESHYTAFMCSRYFFVPYTCIIWLLIIFLDKKIDAFYLAFYTIFFLIHDKYQRHELPDKKWKYEIKEYYEGKRQEIDINPEGWKVILPKK